MKYVERTKTNEEQRERTRKKGQKEKDREGPRKNDMVGNKEKQRTPKTIANVTEKQETAPSQIGVRDELPVPVCDSL